MYILMDKHKYEELLQIEDEITNSNKELRMKELYNWINYLNEN